jgi:hypothetical protein
VLVYFGHFFHKSSPHILATFFPRFRLCIIFLQNNELGYTLGDFFTDSSRHPDPSDHLKKIVVLCFAGLQRGAFSNAKMMHTPGVNVMIALNVTQ